MKKTFTVLILILIILSAFSPDDKINAFLIKRNKQDSIISDTVKSFKTFYVPGEKIDLLYCIRNFSYPPSLPKNLKVKTAASPLGSFNQKCIYDESGRIITYFYHGSLVSGITPYGYDFVYMNDSSFTIRYLKDEFDNSIYDFFYNDVGNIEMIRHSDTSGVTEKLIIQY